MIHIFKIEDENCFEKDIKGDLKSLQEEVGGYITLVPYFPELDKKGIDIYADDEGLLVDSPRINLVRFDESGQIQYGVFGHIVFAGHDGEGGTIGLSEEQINFILDHLLRVKLMHPKSGGVTECFTFNFERRK